jgi:transposase
MAKTIEFTQEERESYSVVTEILGLKELDVIGQEYDARQERQALYCVPRWDVAVCPTCLRVSDQIHDYPKLRRIHDVPLRGKKVILVFDSRRFECEGCKKSFTQDIQDVVPNCTYTHRLYEEIANPKRKQDVATMAELYGIGYKVVESMLLKAGEAKLESRRGKPHDVLQIGIDEIAQKKGMVISS